ncbi:MAG: type I secretion C-terminal target domain-containing protein, partial [Alphaproteobacteria bacterium]|nr:type I secretion C-terminal target domain-containing protein [Alphaproteobacteria bacterium]
MANGADNVGVDSFSGVNSISGSEFDDIILGSNGAEAESFRLRGGNDTVDGRGGDNDRLDYRFSSPTGINADFTSNVTDGSGTVLDGFGTTDTFSNIESIRGTEFNDTITGDGGNNRFQGQSGNDTISGGGGSDALFGDSGDDLIDGGAGDDFLTASSGFNTFIGGAGNDSIQGGLLVNLPNDGNRVDYSSATGAITVNLTGAVGAFGSTVTGDASVGSDSLDSIDAIVGSQFNDVFIVDGSYRSGIFASSPSTFVVIEAGDGDDSITGNGGTRLDYRSANSGVTVNLTTGTGTLITPGGVGDNVGTDTFTGINQITGSDFGDILTGSSASFESFRGLAGNDTIDGGGGANDRVDYLNSASGVTVDLSGGAIGAGTAQDGFGGTDTLTGIENIRGSEIFDDILIGDDGNNEFRARGGNDTITGGLGNDTIRYTSFDDDQIIDLSAGTATGALIGTDTFTGIENVRAGAGNDIITGDANANILRGGFGDNTLIGGAGNDTLRGASILSDNPDDFNRVDYRSATAAIFVDLRDGIDSFTSTASGNASVGIDILVNTEFVYGTNFDDTFTIQNSFAGRFGNFVEIEGGAGNDTINGNGGTRVGYKTALAGVTVNLNVGTAISTLGGDAANIGLNTLSGVNSVRGSDFDDIIIGSNGAQFESFRGQAGNDTIDGGGGLDDRADYRNSPNAIIADLSQGAVGSGTVQDGFLDQFGNSGIDTLINIENIRGSAFADTITGDAGANLVQGRDGADLIRGDAGDDDLRGDEGQDLIFGDAGNDTITGGAGADTLFGGTENDTIDGGSGNDRIDGGTGTDILTGGGGSNTFVFSDFSTDTITDFSLGANQLDVVGLISGNFTVATVNDFVRATETGGTTTVSVDTDGITGGLNFVDVAILTGVGGGSNINLVIDAFGNTTSVVSIATAPAAINLSALSGPDGFVLNGIDVDDNSGLFVSSAGDINGDGFDDMIIGAPLADPNGNSSSGESYLVFGQAGSFGASFELSSLNGINGFVINGIDATDVSGLSVSSAGDINGDGFADLIIGASAADPNSISNAGETYVVFGKAGSFGASLDLSTLNGANGFVINGIDAGDESGGSVSSAGDINGDGFDDVIIGAYAGDPNGTTSGESYVVFGQAGSFGASLDLSTLNGANGFVINGINAGDESGLSVSSAGDINGDGIDDVIIGAYRADPNGNNYAGESYLVFGQSGGFGASLDLSTLNGTTGFVINGIDVGDYSGFSVSSAGDINGDGFDDLIIGAKEADPSTINNAGESYVVFGKAAAFSASLNLSALTAADGFVLNGIDAADFSGYTVSSAGDVNGDGFDDLIIGAIGADPNGNLAAGESYVVFGQAASFGTSFNLSSLNGTNGFIINGIDADDRSGFAVSSAGDVNGDG